MSQPPNSNQQNMIQMMQPAQVTKLLDALKEELAQGKAAGADTAKARQHLAKANQIKQVLLNYQQQQKAAQARANGQAPTVGSGAPATQGQQPLNIANSGQLGGSASPAPGGQGSPMGQQQYQNTAASSAGRQASPSGVNVPNSMADPIQSRPSTGAGATGNSAAPGASGVTTEKYNQVRARIQDLERKIRGLEAGKRPDMSQDEKTQIDNQLNEFRLKYSQYSKFALYMRNQLMDQARTATLTSASPALRDASPNAPLMSAGAPLVQPLVNVPPVGSGSVSMLTPANSNPAIVVANANASVSGPRDPSRPVSGVSSGAITGTETPTKGKSVSPQPKDGSTIPGVNLLGITKPSVPSIPILSTINVNPPNPIILKPGANNVRPTLTGGSASGLGPMMGSPAIVRMPTFEMASTGPIPDNSGRVLTKRKLTELVNTIGADEGDGKTTMDGDVEELLLDLADEFVLSVTTFACRLAKHRKTESVDVRDVQLHLERNWNIRIPGHAMDEIRSMRKWQPSSAYNQKVSGVEIAKAVNGNIK